MSAQAHPTKPSDEREAGLLRVAIDARVVQDRYHGIARQTLELIRALSERDDVALEVIHSREPDRRLSITQLGEHDRIRLIPFDARVASLREQALWPFVLRRLDSDVVMIPYHIAMPWWSPTSTACFIHDCNFEERAADAFPNRKARYLYRSVTRSALRRADAILTCSEATRRALRAHYRVEIPSGNVIPHGVSDLFRTRATIEQLACVRKTFNLPPRFILHVGVRRPHKNQLVLIEAFRALTHLQPPVDLVLIGSPDPRFTDPVDAAVRRFGLEERVHRIANMPDEVLPSAYQAASAFAFPSLQEGFGLPLLEAMASGIPTIASDIPVLTEVAADAALHVLPQDPVGWTKALEAVLNQPTLAKELSDKGRERAARFTWSRSADLLFAALAELRGRRGA